MASGLSAHKPIAVLRDMMKPRTTHYEFAIFEVYCIKHGATIHLQDVARHLFPRVSQLAHGFPVHET
jgi:hypothetical protein